MHCNAIMSHSLRKADVFRGPLQDEATCRPFLAPAVTGLVVSE
jgi:hypothetical protein